jgi:hypothetical protein
MIHVAADDQASYRQSLDHWSRSCRHNCRNIGSYPKVIQVVLL